MNPEQFRYLEDELIQILRAQEEVTMAHRRDDLKEVIRKWLIGILTNDRYIPEIATLVFGCYYYHIDCKSGMGWNSETGNGSISLCVVRRAFQQPEPRIRFAYPIRTFPLGWGIATAEEIMDGHRMFCCLSCEKTFLEGKILPEKCPDAGSSKGSGKPYMLYYLSVYRPLENLWEQYLEEFRKDRRLIEVSESVSSAHLRGAL